jgi:hypothetical protein
MGPKQKFQLQHRFLNCHPLSPEHGNEQTRTIYNFATKNAREVKKCKEPLAFTVGVFRKQQRMADVF